MKPFRRETALYLLAFVLALAVRLIRLGAWPLTDLEAKWALQALGVAQGTQPALGSQPAYVLLTSIFFFIFGGGTNFLARFVPALIGSALAFVPFLFRERLRPRPSLILAFFLALDPGLVALSRQAGSSILAITFLFFAWGFWEKKNTRWAGIFAGLALLSGPALWAGLLGLGLTWAIRQAWERGLRTESAQSPARSEWLSALWFGIGTLVFGGTLFFLSPNGLSAWMSALPEYIAGWQNPSGFSFGFLLFSLVVYQPLALILGLIALVRGWRYGSLRVKRLSLWALVTLLLALFYPARQASGLAWMLIPLWSLAALELTRNLNIFREERVEVLGVVSLSVLILTFSWLDFLALIQLPVPSDQTALRMGLLFGSLFLLVVSILLVAVGWSIRSARLGAIWGLVAVLSVYSLGAMFGAGGLRASPGSEFWSSGALPAEEYLLLTTVDQVSDWSKTNVNAQPITIVGIKSPALEWLLRKHKVEVVDSLDVSVSPPIIITTEQDNPGLAAGYRGQGFVWRQQPLWGNALLPDWMSWIVFRQMPQTSETIIVWVRSDLFIDSTGMKP
ncbi:MAG: hypothetical protein HYR70_00150 [Chloroflexi bacterium]|nr:hypothetical protein [Chloroflexota bacterium]MBI3340408.1 hypothetical protein [Chloroflexota bacterium]